MAKQRYINTKFWDDEYIQSLNPTEKLLFLYCFTNPSTNIAGIYELTLRRIEFDTGIDTLSIRSILKRFEKDKKIYLRDGWLIICNFPKHQEWEKSPKIKLGIEKVLKELPPNIKGLLDTLSIPYIYPPNYSNLNSNTNKTYGVKTPNIKKPMDTILLDDNGERIESPPQPKKYGKKKLYAKIAVHYMTLTGKTGNALRHYPAVKEIYELYQKDFPNDTEEQAETEIIARINIANNYYLKAKRDWSLGKVAENWNKILTEWNKNQGE